MNKEKAFNEVKELLEKNGIEFTVADDGETITAKAGKIVQWFMFTDSSISVSSFVIEDLEIIDTARITTAYEDIREFNFIDGEMWIRTKGFGYTIISFNEGKGE